MTTGRVFAVTKKNWRVAGQVFRMIEPLCEDSFHEIVVRYNEIVAKRHEEMLVATGIASSGPDDGYTLGLPFGRYCMVAVQKTQYKIKKFADGEPQEPWIDQGILESMTGCDKRLKVNTRGNFKPSLYNAIIKVTSCLTGPMAAAYLDFGRIERLTRLARDQSIFDLEISFPSTAPAPGEEVPYRVTTGRYTYLARYLWEKGGVPEAEIETINLNEIV